MSVVERPQPAEENHGMPSHDETPPLLGAGEQTPALNPKSRAPLTARLPIGTLARRVSVRGRLTLLNMIVLALVLTCMAVAVRYTVEINLKAALDRDMKATSHMALQRWNRLSPAQRDILLAALRARGGQLVGGSLAEVFTATTFGGARSGMPPFYRPRLVTRNRHNYLTLAKLEPWDNGAYLQSLRGYEDAYATVNIGSDVVRVYSSPIVSGNRVDGVVQLAESLNGIRHTVNVLTRTLFALIPIALLVVGLGSMLLTDGALKPVGRMAEVAGEISAKDLSRRLDVAGDDEFANLAGTFNSMLGRLEDSFGKLEAAYQRQQQFTGDASHELRSPLTVIKANTSLALTGVRSADDYREALVAADRAADHMNAVVQDLLFLARADAGRSHRQFETVRLVDVLSEAAATAPKGAAQVTVDVDDPAATVKADRMSILRLVTNLLSNAIRYTPSDGSITLSARIDGDEAVISVADTGEGIDARHIPHLTERFYRCDSARTRTDGGAGLGLAIVRSIVDDHHGTLSIDSIVGAGSTFTVRLPKDGDHH